MPNMIKEMIITICFNNLNCAGIVDVIFTDGLNLLVVRNTLGFIHLGGMKEQESLV